MEETIELRELINIIWKGKIVIIISTIICLLLAWIISWFIMEDKYESKALVQVVSGTQDMGVLSNYIATEFKPNVYAERIQNELLMQQAFIDSDIQSEFLLENLSVQVEMDALKNNVALKYTSNSAQTAQQELEVLMNSVEAHMSEAIQFSLKDLESLYKVEIENLSPEIAEVVDLYNKIVRDNNLPDILMLQTIVDKNAGILLNSSEQQKTALSNIDGNIQNQLIQLQSEIQTKTDEYRKVLTNYQSVKSSLTSFKSDPFIRVITEPTLAKQPSGPSKVLNLALGLIIGVMLGLGGIFFRAYWKNSNLVK